jgi:thiosulfate/3-mercaptopyruvate sulfurtransferase
MIKMRFPSILLGLIILLSANLKAQDVISAKDFMAELKKNKDIVVVEASTEDNYKKHIPNAVFISHKSLYKDGDIEGLIKSPEELAKIFGENGIGNDTPVIIYDDGSSKYNSRVYWILKYIGATNVRLLHKDMEKAWRQVRVPLTAGASKVEPKTFTPKVNKAIIAIIDEVKKALANSNAVVIDARAANEYNGTSEKPVSKGHIKGAINIEYKEFLTENGDFKSKDEILAVAKKHGLSPDKEIIAYCVTSVRACPIYVALTGVGYKNVKVYDGAYNEWIADPSNPLAK